MIIALLLKGVLLAETKNKFSEFNQQRKNINNITKIKKQVI